MIVFWSLKNDNQLSVLLKKLPANKILRVIYSDGVSNLVFARVLDRRSSSCCSCNAFMKYNKPYNERLLTGQHNINVMFECDVTS